MGFLWTLILLANLACWLFAAFVAKRSPVPLQKNPLFALAVLGILACGAAALFLLSIEAASS